MVMESYPDTILAALPGLFLSPIIALAVRFVSDRLGEIAMLYALLGIRIATGDVLNLGWPVIGLIVAAVGAIVLQSLFLAVFELGGLWLIA